MGEEGGGGGGGGAVLGGSSGLRGVDGRQAPLPRALQLLSLSSILLET